MEDLWTKQDKDQSIEELFESSEDAYLIYIIFESNLFETELESKVIKVLNNKFNAECFTNTEFGESIWCITWD